MDPRRDPTGIRQSRIQKIHQMLKGAGDVPLKRFLASCEYSMGLTRQKVRVYLMTLEDLEYIEVDEEKGIIREVTREATLDEPK